MGVGTRLIFTHRQAEKRSHEMPLYMDIHESVPAGTTAQDVAGAHAADLSVQGKYGVDYRKLLGRRGQRQGVLPGRRADPQAAVAVHKEAHGLLADHIHEVVQG